MGKRKRLAAEARKEEMKSIAIAKLNNCPTSPRKMRLVADSVRGKDVFQALNILKFSPQCINILKRPFFFILDIFRTWIWI